MAQAKGVGDLERLCRRPVVAGRSSIQSLSSPVVHHVRKGESIQSCLDTCDPGDEVIIHEGIYDEALSVKVRNLRIAAADGETVAIHTTVSTDAPAAVTFMLCNFAAFEGIAVRNDTGVGVMITRAVPCITDCMISGLTGGVRITANHEYPKMCPTIARCTIHKSSRGCGIALVDAKAIIERNNISQNADAGVMYSGLSNPWICGNTIAGGKGAGIAIQTGATGVIAENVIERNECAGVVVEGGARPVVWRNSITRGGAEGARLEPQAKGIFEENVFADNASCDVMIEYGSEAFVHKCAFRGGPSVAMLLQGGSPAVSFCTFRDYGASFITATGGGAPVVRDNVFSLPAHQHAVALGEHCGGEVEGNMFHRQVPPVDGASAPVQSMHDIQAAGYIPLVHRKPQPAGVSTAATSGAVGRTAASAISCKRGSQTRVHNNTTKWVEDFSAGGSNAFDVVEGLRTSNSDVAAWLSARGDRARHWQAMFATAVGLGDSANATPVDGVLDVDGVAPGNVGPELRRRHSSFADRLLSLSKGSELFRRRSVGVLRKASMSPELAATAAVAAKSRPPSGKASGVQVVVIDDGDDMLESPASSASSTAGGAPRVGGGDTPPAEMPPPPDPAADVHVEDIPLPVGASLAAVRRASKHRSASPSPTHRTRPVLHRAGYRSSSAVPSTADKDTDALFVKANAMELVPPGAPQGRPVSATSGRPSDNGAEGNAAFIHAGDVHVLAEDLRKMGGGPTPASTAEQRPQPQGSPRAAAVQRAKKAKSRGDGAGAGAGVGAYKFPVDDPPGGGITDLLGGGVGRGASQPTSRSGSPREAGGEAAPTARRASWAEKGRARRVERAAREGAAVMRKISLRQQQQQQGGDAAGGGGASTAARRSSSAARQARRKSSGAADTARLRKLSAKARASSVRAASREAAIAMGHAPHGHTPATATATATGPAGDRAGVREELEV